MNKRYLFGATKMGQCLQQATTFVALCLCSVGLECRQCRDALVNADERFVLQATLVGLREDDVTIEWKAYEVQDGSVDLGSDGESLLFSVTSDPGPNIVRIVRTVRLFDGNTFQRDPSLRFLLV